MITFPHGISDEAIETLAEQTQEEVATATHNLAVKRKKLKEAGVPEDDEQLKGIDEMMEVI